MITAPLGHKVRPTSDRVRETVFNILSHRLGDDGWLIDGTQVLDGFAGTGAMGLEALSRGACHVTFMDIDIAPCRANIERLREEARCEIVSADCLRPPPAPAPTGLIFIDPPYESNLVTPTLKFLVSGAWLHQDTPVVVESGFRNGPIPSPEGLAIRDSRRYGDTQISVYSLTQRGG